MHTRLPFVILPKIAKDRWYINLSTSYITFVGWPIECSVLRQWLVGVISLGGYYFSAFLTKWGELDSRIRKRFGLETSKPKTFYRMLLRRKTPLRSVKFFTCFSTIIIVGYSSPKNLHQLLYMQRTIIMILKQPSYCLVIQSLSWEWDIKSKPYQIHLKNYHNLSYGFTAGIHDNVSTI